MTSRPQPAAVLLAIVAAVLIVSAQQPQTHLDAPLTDAQLKALVQRAIAMQHRTYDALDLYDRTERVVRHDGGEKPTDITSRLVPVGASEIRVELSRNGMSLPADQISRKWQYVLDVIDMRLHNPDPAVRREFERAQRRKDYTAKMVDAIADAFIFHYSGRAMRDGRPVIVLDYEPNPQFDASLRYSSIYKQVWGKVWVDESSGAVVRMEAELRNDIPIVAGIVAKIYKGARVELDQAQPFLGADVWLPTKTSYDIEYRKFAFQDSIHRKLYASDYRRIGPPAEALPLLRNEHLQAAAPAPTVNGTQY